MAEITVNDLFTVTHQHVVFTIAEGLLEIFLKDNYRKELLKGLLEVFNKIVILYTDNEQYSFRRSLASLKEVLPDVQFFQISKSALVNLKTIQKLEFTFSGSLYAYLKNGQKITVFWRFVDRLKHHLGVQRRKFSLQMEGCLICVHDLLLSFL